MSIYILIYIHEIYIHETCVCVRVYISLLIIPHKVTRLLQAHCSEGLFFVFTLKILSPSICQCSRLGPSQKDSLSSMALTHTKGNKLDQPHINLQKNIFFFCHWDAHVFHPGAIF